MRRARRTCESAGLGAHAKIALDLAEWDYGDHEGLRTVDIRNARPNWNVFREGCPHGELPGQAADRADRLIAHLSTVDGNVALLSHGQFGCVLAARWIELGVAQAEHFTLGPATMNILSYNIARPTCG